MTPHPLGWALLFYGDTPARHLALRVAYSLKCLFHSVRGALRPRPNTDSILADGDRRAVLACFSPKTPKEIFLLLHAADIQRRENRHGH